MKAKTKPPAAPGDVVVTGGHRVGESGRMGEIVDVSGEPGHEHFRVRWEDGHESVLYSLEDVTVRPAHA